MALIVATFQVAVGEEDFNVLRKMVRYVCLLGRLGPACLMDGLPF